MRNIIFFHQCLSVTVFEVVIGAAVPLAVQIKCWDNFYVRKHLKDRFYDEHLMSTLFITAKARVLKTFHKLHR